MSGRTRNRIKDTRAKGTTFGDIRAGGTAVKGKQKPISISSRESSFKITTNKDNINKDKDTVAGV